MKLGKVTLFLFLESVSDMSSVWFA